MVSTLINYKYVINYLLSFKVKDPKQANKKKHLKSHADEKVEQMNSIWREY